MDGVQWCRGLPQACIEPKFKAQIYLLPRKERATGGADGQGLGLSLWVGPRAVS